MNDFEFCGDLYKVKTFFEITKLEKNGMFVYESVPKIPFYPFLPSDAPVSTLQPGRRRFQHSSAPHSAQVFLRDLSSFFQHWLIVAGSLVLVGGDPGIGKSTLLLQMCGGLSQRDYSVLYISGEESLQQIRLRADRLDNACPG